MKIRRSIISFCFLLTLLIGSGPVIGKTSTQKVQLNLRKIGHELLIQLDDSTSRVMPIKKEGNRYAVYFENPLEFRPSTLVFATEKVLYQEKTNERYFVEVETCDSSDIVYSFEWIPNQELYNVACEQRALPLDCYVIYFSVDPVDPLTADKSESSTYFWSVLIGISLIFLSFLIWYYLSRKRTQQLMHFIPIGQFKFDLKEMTLNREAQSIQLSAKEADLLQLLHENENKTVKREDILRIVWGDEGDYVGRTLDVFISKLRKKLEADPNLKIVNIRGVGYRFVVKS